MKKIIIISVGVIVSSVLFFSACTKTNVKHPKQIIGTWSLASETSDYTHNDLYSVTYTPVNTCWTSYTEESSGSGSYDINGTSVHEVSSYVYKYDGVVDSEENVDTTYSFTENIFTITFNEDGTCLLIESVKGTDEDGNTDNYSTEYSGYWNWLDSYEEKTAINIVLSGGNDGKGDSGMQFYEMFFYIESFEKDVMEISYSTESTYSSEYTEIYFCSEDIDRVYKYTGTYSESGKRVLNKEE